MGNILTSLNSPEAVLSGNDPDCWCSLSVAPVEDSKECVLECAYVVFFSNEDTF